MTNNESIAALTPALSHREREMHEAVLADLLEQMADELKARGSVDAAAWQERYPELATEIERLVPTLGLLVEFSSSGGAPPLGDIDESHANKTLGDFRIMRELGRGGMGIVYEAEQLSLGRRVALKILPTAAVLDPRTLQRFKNEAQAAAALDHPHIVAVYGIGCERGIHYYAMRLIDGCTLADVIADIRAREQGTGDRDGESQVPSSKFQVANLKCETSNLKHLRDTHPLALLSTVRENSKLAYVRKVAELGIHVAEALAHAHEQGIIHRDIKPSNLMLDGQGKVWITDFGLAQIENSVSLTQTGDLLGTLRYMSPEQTLAGRAPIDHRCDLYSLGATLYELLTLESVFAGDNRAELLQRIALTEPSPPRRINPQIPSDLETIILKMLQKDAASRYASAGELAADLKRFLDNKPIAARRPTSVQRLAKWSARNRAAVSGIGAATLLVVAAVSGILGWWSRDAAAQRLVAEQVAGEALTASDKYRQHRQWSAALQELKRAQAAVSARPVRGELERQIEQRTNEVELAIRLDEIRLQAASLAGSDFDLAAADAAYQAALAEFGFASADPAPATTATLARLSLTEPLAEALTNWGVIRLRRQDATGRSLLRLADALDPDPWRARLRGAYATGRLTPHELSAVAQAAPIETLPASTLFLLVQAAAATHHAADDKLVDRVRHIQRLQADDFWINFAVARFFESQLPRQDEDAVRYYSVAVGVRPAAAAAHSNLGAALGRLGRQTEAIAALRLAIEAEPGFYVPYFNLGHVLCEEQQYAEAIEAFRKAAERSHGSAVVHQRLAAALQEQGLLDEAIAEYRRALAIDPANVAAHDGLEACMRIP